MAPLPADADGSLGIRFGVRLLAPFYDRRDFSISCRGSLTVGKASGWAAMLLCGQLLVALTMRAGGLFRESILAR